MRAIWKFLLPITPETARDGWTLSMPWDAHVVSCQTQGGVPALWAVVETTNPPTRRRFVFVGTGHELPVGQFIGTVQECNGLVWHIFEPLFQDAKAAADQARWSTMLADSTKVAKRHGVRIGHTQADGCRDYDAKGPSYTQLRHSCPSGHDAPGPWDRCEWPSDDRQEH